MAITNARMQIKRGNEVDFDAEKMLVGEWALSTDKRIVRICVAPNVCIRMATYDAFEVDMARIDEILEECRTIEDVVKLINSQVSEKLELTIEYTNQAKQYRDETEQFRNEVESMVDIGIATTEKAGIVKPDGITIRVDEDGTIHADNGTVDYNELENKPSINGMELSGDKSLDELGIASVEALEETNYKVDTILEKAGLTLKNTASGSPIHLTDSANGKNVGFGLYGKATQDGEPTPDNPIEIVVSGSDGSVEVVSCGKNFWSPSSKTTNENGVERTGITVPSGTYTISNNSDGDVFVRDGLASKDTITIKTKTVQTFTFSLDGFIWIPTATISTSDIQVEKGTVATEYEPYKKTTSTIPTPNGLCGIKVSSGGNYTDENGQMWICDEVAKYADGSGKRIQRIGKSVIDGSNYFETSANNYSENCMMAYCNGLPIVSDTSLGKATIGYCDKFQMIDAVYISNTDVEGVGVHYIAGESSSRFEIRIRKDRLSSVDVAGIKAWLTENPVTVYYRLAEPIITDLSAEEIAEIEKLYTFYPVTNISNDSECGMSITYMADAKNYIDNRLALIESAMLNNI